jgi:hypothetical protein
MRTADVRGSVTTMSQEVGSGHAMAQWDEYAEKLRAQLPAAPPALLEGYNKYMPWVFIIFGILGLLGLLAVAGIAGIATPLMVAFGGSRGLASGGTLWFDVITGLVLAALQIVGGFMMRDRKHTGWWLIAIGQVVGLLTALLSVSVFAIVIRALIGYVHLMVKPDYTN